MGGAAASVSSGSQTEPPSSRSAPAFETAASMANSGPAGGGETLGKCVLQYDGTGVYAVGREGGTATGTNSFTSAGAMATVPAGPARCGKRIQGCEN